jgi:XapX domain-containing protein
LWLRFLNAPEERDMVEVLLALALGLGIGVGCRWFDLPLPAPPRLVGALLVVAMTLGFMGMDRVLGTAS